MDITRKELSVRLKFVLFNPGIAPFSFAGALVRLFAGTRHSAVFNFPVGRAEHKLNVPAMLARMADNARCARWRITPGRNKIREFLVFIAQIPAFQLPVLRRAFYTLGEMAPIPGRSHGARVLMRTRGRDGGRVGNQKGPRSV